MCYEGAVLLLLSLLCAALAGPAALDSGDGAWFAGDRIAARAAWLEAAKEADPATVAMAEVRLLRVSGNLGLLSHGPRADRALADCAAADPWCALAWADYHLTLADLGLPADPGLAAALARQAASALPGPALARQVWAGAAPAEALEGDPTALGQGLAQHGGRWPSGPGTWLLALGLSGAPGLGVGGALRFAHPDLGGGQARLELSAAATSRGALALSVASRIGRRSGALLSASGARAVVDLYDQEAETQRSLIVGQAAASAAPLIQVGRWSGWAGPAARVDVGEALLQGHGAFGGLAWDGTAAGGGPWARLSAEGAFADYTMLRASLDLRERWAVPGGVLASRLLGEAALRDARTPVWRLPSAGGAELLRGAPSGRFRGPGLLAAALEYRHPLGPTLSLALFADTVWVSDPGPLPSPHGGAGAGLRLHLPPRPLNTVRLDLGFTDAGWGLVAGWGEAF